MNRLPDPFRRAWARERSVPGISVRHACGPRRKLAAIHTDGRIEDIRRIREQAAADKPEQMDGSVTHEEFTRKNKLIADKLQAIADRTINMAWVGSAHSSNPEFSGLMKAQQQLIDAADKLLKTYVDRQSAAP